MHRFYDILAGTALAAVLALAAPTAYGAGLIGDQVNASASGLSVSPGTVTVAADTSDRITYGLFGIDLIIGDLGQSSFQLSTLRYVGSFSGSDAITLSGLDFDGGANVLSDVSLSITGNIPGLTKSNLSISASSLTINLGGTEWDSNASATITFITAPAVPAPEPASLALLATGLLGLAGAARRRAAPAMPASAA